MTRFINHVNEKHALKLSSYDDLYGWSIRNIPDFWAIMWEFGQIIASRKYDKVVDDLTEFPGANWFSGARLNFAENQLRYKDDHIAIVFKGEIRRSVSMTYSELYISVARLANSLRQIGVQSGDRVAAYMPNLTETAIAMLATAAIGGVWCSCATDLGAQAALDRLGQIQPKVLFTVDGYYYRGKYFSCLDKAAQVTRGIRSLEKVILVRYTGEETNISHIPQSIYYDEFLTKEKSLEIRFEQMPFDHPVFIMFS